MCGINGIVSFGRDIDIHQSIQSMNDLIVHRGPDAIGYDVQGNLALGHTRLSILDLSERGTQPMHYGGRYTIVFNGEIYNYLEVKEELLNANYKFGTDTDTEVIIAAYAEWGDECVKKFNGMWSFILFDAQEKKIFCSRDRFGIKPFYYYYDKNILCISSEIKPLLSFLPNRKVNYNTLLNYLVLDICDEGEETFFCDIQRLLPSHNMIVKLEQPSLEIRQYYNLAENVRKKMSQDEEELMKEFDELMTSSIGLRLRADVRVGSCLSGGLDSSFITGIASNNYSKENNQAFFAFTAKSSDTKNDESIYAKEVVDHCKLKWMLFTPSLKEFQNLIDEVVITQEEPFRSPSIFLQYGIMKEAKSKGCKVLLDGQGGDETFLGYERYYIPFLRKLPPLKFMQNINQISNHSKLSKFTLLQLCMYMSLNWVRKKKLVQRTHFLKKNRLTQVRWDYIKNLNEISYRELQISEITQFNLPALLRYEDKNSMRFGVETRLPFLDYRVVEFAIGVKQSLKIREGWTKYIIRKVGEKYIPHNITWRKNKIGFEPPSRIWLERREFFYKKIKGSKILNEILENKSFEVKDDNLLWKLYNVAKWEDLFNVNT